MPQSLPHVVQSPPIDLAAPRPLTVSSRGVATSTKPL